MSDNQLKWVPFKLEKYAKVEHDDRLTKEYKDEVFANEVYENIDKAIKDKKFMVIIELIKEFVRDMDRYKPFYQRHLDWKKNISPAQNFVVDVTSSLILNWTYFLTKLKEKGGWEYVEYIQRKLNLPKREV